MIKLKKQDENILKNARRVTAVRGGGGLSPKKGGEKGAGPKFVIGRSKKLKGDVITDYERKYQLRNIFKMFESNKLEKKLDSGYVKELSKLMLKKDKNYQRKRTELVKSYNFKSTFHYDYEKNKIFHMTSEEDQNNISSLNNFKNNILIKDNLNKIEHQTYDKHYSFINDDVTYNSQYESIVNDEIKGNLENDTKPSFDDLLDVDESIDALATKLKDDQKIKIFKKLTSQYNFFHLPNRGIDLDKRDGDKPKPKLSNYFIRSKVISLPDIQKDIRSNKIPNRSINNIINRPNLIIKTDKIKLIDIYNFDKKKIVSKETTLAITLLNNLKNLDSNKKIKLSVVNPNLKKSYLNV